MLQSYEECLRCKRIIDPIILESGTIINQKRFRDVLVESSCWTNSTSELLEIFDQFVLEDNDTSINTALVAHLASVLELSLASVYETITHDPPPHLLKDLLKAIKKVDLFNPIQIFVLQIVLGSSKGLNLRNLTWHGFLENVDHLYVSFLFVLFVSYGSALTDTPIVPRKRSTLLVPIVFDSEVDFSTLLKSPTIQKCNFRAWQTILKLHDRKRFKTSIYLMLPQIEALLRVIYGEMNRVDVNAKLDNYYIILDSIFYEYVLDVDCTPLVIGKINKAKEILNRKINRKNQMIELFPPSLMHLGYDLFHAADGPRIRDKLSHGEAVCEENNDEIAEKLLRFAALIIQFCDSGEIAKFEYKSIYMNNLKLQRIYNATCDSVCVIIAALKIPQSLRSESHRFDWQLSKLDLDVKCFFRPLMEAQIVKLLLKILDKFVDALEKFLLSCNELFVAYEERKLSSSRRQTAIQLVDLLPNFYNGFRCILNIVGETFRLTQQIDEDKSDHESCSQNNLLKHSLRLVENLVKHFSPNSRNFYVANEKMTEFLQFFTKSTKNAKN